MGGPVAFRNDLLINGYSDAVDRLHQNSVKHVLQCAGFGKGISLLVYGNVHPGLIF